MLEIFGVCIKRIKLNFMISSKWLNEPLASPYIQVLKMPFTKTKLTYHKNSTHHSLTQ